MLEEAQFAGGGRYTWSKFHAWTEPPASFHLALHHGHWDHTTGALLWWKYSWTESSVVPDVTQCMTVGHETRVIWNNRITGRIRIKNDSTIYGEEEDATHSSGAISDFEQMPAHSNLPTVIVREVTEPWTPECSNMDNRQWLLSSQQPGAWEGGLAGGKRLGSFQMRHLGRWVYVVGGYGMENVLNGYGTVKAYHWN